ncbi:MAG TPA: hypothetical protein VGE59_02630 [Patescibacteria group bacterium]
MNRKIGMHPLKNNGIPGGMNDAIPGTNLKNSSGILTIHARGGDSGIPVPGA